MGREKTAYLSLLSVLSAVAVVFLHTNGCFWTFSTGRYWATANIIESVFYFAVPVFFMISGATLLDYRERYNTRQFFAKRASKTVVPFLFWSLVGLVLALTVYRTVSWKDVSLWFVLDGLLNTRFVSVYWFFIPLFCVYAAIPLFGAVPKERRQSVFTYLAIVCFAVNSLLPFLVSVFGLPVRYSVRVDVGASYLLYILLGYLLNEVEWKRPLRYTLYGAAVAGLLLHMVGTYILSMQSGSVISTYKGYVAPPTVLYAMGLFVFFRQTGPRLMRGFVGKLVNALQGYTFAIYLLHMILLPLLRKLFAFNTFSIVYRLGMPFVVIPLCILLTWLVRKVPVLRRVLP